MGNKVSISPVGAVAGALIEGLDLARPLAAGSAEQVRKALADHGVIFFRNQTLTPEQHLAFARTFGAINVNRFFKSVAGYPEIAEVRKEPNQKTNIGGGWHTDHSYDTEPALGSVLYAREVPPTGGDTLFSSMYAAYDALSDGLKQTLAGLRAVHSSRHVFGVGGRAANTDLGDRIGNPELATQDAIHPVVVTHPDSARKLLYVNPGFTLRFEGWTDAESQPLLNFLYQHAARPEFGCRWHWEKGSLAVWDNRATWHLALNDYHGYRRLMHRVTVEGVALS
jgi:taurine dioxygenase